LRLIMPTTLHLLLLLLLLLLPLCYAQQDIVLA
jgi:hypothetical protein